MTISHTEAMYALRAVVVGLGATLIMDLAALILTRVFSIASASYCLVGRWMCHMPEGVFKHANIADASAKPLECVVGWVGHYVIGAIYALALVAFVSYGWLAHPTLLPALVFGIGSVVVPFLVMHPAFGLGVAASRAPSPWQARLKSLMAHTVFGVGLYACALTLRDALPVHT